MKTAEPQQTPAPSNDVAQRLEIVLESMRDGLLAIDRDWRIDLVNSCAAAMLGRQRDAMLGRDFREDIDIAVIEGVRQVMERRRPLSFEHFSNAGGRWHDYRLSPSPDGGVVMFFVDITERKQAAERALLVAQHDALTGLANRKLLREEAERILAAARRQGHRIAILFMDLDRFKPVNDSHGHEAGDKLLKTVARRISSTLRAEDAIGRIGGDEFVAVLVGIKDAEDAGRVAANIVETLRRPYRVGGLTLEIGASVGISLFPTHGESIDVLFKRADAAMYVAKRSGRGRFAFYARDAQAGGAAAADPGLPERLHAALVGGEFSLDFQPLFASASADVVAAEALIRWRRPDGSQVPPQQFLPVAEATGLIKPIGDWLLHEACLQQQRWTAAGFDITVGVTISGAQFRQQDFAQRVAQIVARTGIDAARLLLNIAESDITGNVEESLRVLRELHAVGVGVAIKHFGAGDSNIRALARLPVDKLRLDRSFMQHGTGPAGPRANGNGHAAADAVIGLGHSLRREVVVEGVEEESDMDYLRARGVEYCQGFLLAAPMPAADFAAWWQARSSGEPPRRGNGADGAAVAHATGVWD